MTIEPHEFLISLSERLWPIANERFSDLSPAERIFILVWEVDAEVNNGGFNQFFFNSEDDRPGATPDALRSIGAARMASIVDRAIALFPDGLPPARFERQRILEGIDPETEIFEGLDDEFYDYPDDLTELLHRFVMEHRSEIRGA